MQRAATFMLAKLTLLAGSIWLAPVSSVAQAQGGAPAGAKPADAAALAAAAPRAVLELYTSQGCSSCPPADALFQKYVARKDVVALSFPVDYWDYLGWKDTLANAKFSARQRAYAKQRGDGRIYTPQMVVNGSAHSIGSVAQEIEQTIAAQEAQFAKSRVAVQIRAEKGQLVIDAGAAPDGSTVTEASFWLASVQREAEVPVRGGENRGRTLKYYNVVRELTPVGMWTGKAMTVRLDREAVTQPEGETFAVLLQSGKGGPVVGAAILARN